MRLTDRERTICLYDATISVVARIGLLSDGELDHLESYLKEAAVSVSDDPDSVMLRAIAGALKVYKEDN
jgi:hypothetical protein